MKTKKMLWIVFDIVLTLVVVFTCIYVGQNKNGKSPKALLPANDMIKEKFDESSAQWYGKIISVMVDENKQSDEKVVQEYILVNETSFQGTEYVNVKIIDDQTGELTHKLYHHKHTDVADYSGKGEFTIDETFPLSEEQTAQIVSVFEDNNFWEIPSQHPDEQLGLDGNTVYIEGINGDKYNIISMWHPDEKYEIQKIYSGVKALVNTWQPISE